MTIEEMLERKKELGLSYDMISQKSGIPLGTVQKVLGGITKSPRYETLVALERVLAKPERVLEKTERTLAASERPNSVQDLYDRRQGTYTVSDYLALPDDQRYELIDGVLYAMAAPSISHQEIAGEIYAQLRNYIRINKCSCKALISPVDVQLDDDDRTMVQPDVMILCDREKIENGKRLIGAPDFVVEVLSDSTGRKDLTVKLYKYRRAGVREYWVVDPENRLVIVYGFESGGAGFYTFDEKIPVGIYESKCEVDLSEI